MLGSRIGLMHQGKLLLLETPENFLKSKETQALAYIETLSLPVTDSERSAGGNARDLFGDFLQQNWPELLTLLRQHLWLVFISTLIAVVIGIPTGILLTRKQSLRGPVLGIANVMQTIPSLALFRISDSTAFHRRHWRAHCDRGARALCADADHAKHGDRNSRRRSQRARGGGGDGNDGRQILWQVELPLAMSVILTGVRVATVIAVGVTTIAAEVGAGGLGVYIIRGLRQYDNNLLLAGAVPAALMALAADFSLGLLEQRFSVETKTTADGAAIVNRIVLAAIGSLVLLGAYGAWRASRAESRISLPARDAW